MAAASPQDLHRGEDLALLCSYRNAPTPYPGPAGTVPHDPCLAVGTPIPIPISQCTMEWAMQALG